MGVIGGDSDSSSDEKNPKPEQKTRMYGVARKSTANNNSSNNNVTEKKMINTRRQAALAKNIKTLEESNEKFMENFDPDRSLRERRKLSRRIGIRRPPGALYDEFGVHIASDVDLCDCLQKGCNGCHFPCPKCKSQKCGLECRVNRKFMYDQIEYQGCDLIVKNPLLKQL